MYIKYKYEYLLIMLWHCDLIKNILNIINGFMNIE